MKTEFEYTLEGIDSAASEILKAFDGRKISFDVEAYDNAGLIGKGTHERFTVKIDKFMLKAQERKNITAEKINI